MQLYKFLLLPCCLWSVQAHATSVTDQYIQWKKDLHTQHGFDYSLKADFMAQRGAPAGHKTIFRSGYKVAAGFDLFQSDTIGTGNIQFLYIDINYPSIYASKLGRKLGVVSPINDETAPREYFKKLTYTHQLPGRFNQFSVSVGQFVIGNFGKIRYDSLPWNHFTNDSFQSNVTKTHPTAGMGGYVTYDISPQFTLSGGCQSSTNNAPQNIRLKYLDDHKWTNFLYVSWRPDWTSLGKSNITGWIYHAPAVKKYPGRFNKALKQSSDGWVLNAKQEINRWVFALKINGATGRQKALTQSYGTEIIYNNPLNRNPMDQIGFGFAMNKVNRQDKNTIRSWESVAEAYWNWGLGRFMTITPDVQVYINPALTQRHKPVTVTTLQTKIFF